jgi:hypothetical protein
MYACPPIGPIRERLAARSPGIAGRRWARPAAPDRVLLAALPEARRSREKAGSGSRPFGDAPSREGDAVSLRLTLFD